MNEDLRAPLPDESARRLARERFDVPVLLEAGAGTGKTRALVERLLAWTLDAGWREAADRLEERARSTGGSAPGLAAVADDVLDGVVAITFTDAAAAEMASRLAGALGDIAAGRAPRDGAEAAATVDAETAAARAAALLDRLGRARIQTIHAFCRGLLAEHPFEAGLHPAFSVDADEQALERIATETVAEQLTLRLGGDGDRELLALLADGVDAEAILAAVLEAARAGIPATTLEVDPFPPAAVEAELARAAESVLALVAVLDEVAGKLNDKQAGFLAALRALLDLLGDGGEPGVRLESVSGSIDRLHDEYSDYLKKWPRGESIATIEKHRAGAGEPLASVAERARRAFAGLGGVSPARLAIRRKLTASLLRVVRERLRREGFLLFGDLLDRATELVSRRAEIRDSIRRGIRQLLVDEFQDTDRRQCELVERIALDPGGAPRPGLFVVGDPKQSIYSWRGADLAAYERFLARALAQGGIRARLTVNFRSIAGLLAEVERAVGPAMVEESGLQPPFEGLVASAAGVSRGAVRAGSPAVEYWSSTGSAGPATRAAEANRLEARALARDLLRQRELEPDLAWRDFGILARATSELEVVLKALREAGVPFAIERDRSYWRRREVVDAAAAVRAILEPGDHLALVAFLRSPFVGVPDAALIPLWEGGLPALVDGLSAPEPGRLAEISRRFEETARKIEGTVPGLERIAEWESSAIAAVEVVAELRATFGREPAEDWVERLRSRLAPEATAAGRFLGRFGVANLARFFRQLTAQLESDGADPGAIVRALRRAVGERRVAEEAQPPRSDGDAVRVMTIHKAKGLEFRQVYVVQLHRGTGNPPPKPFEHDLHAGGAGAAYRLLDARTLGWSAAAERRETVADRERVRLLYVAMTRARDRLVLAGQLFSTRAPDSLATLLAGRRAETPAATGPPATAQSDAFGAFWRTPALEPGEPGAPRVVPPPDPVAPDEVADALDRLTARRLAATARGARHRVRRASDLGGLDFATEEGPDGDLGSPADLARRRGIALHRALELAPLAAADAAAWRTAARIARGTLPGSPDEAALDADLDALLRSALWRRLAALEPTVLARELPLLVAPEPTSEDDPDAPLEGWVGTLDLLYRDPGSGELVVADFKSDAIADEVAATADRYAPQLRLYGRAVRDALGLVAPPRLELWWLAADRIERVG